MSGCLVLVDRLVAGVPISGVRYSDGDRPWNGALVGPDSVKLAAFNVNVNMQKRTIRHQCHIQVLAYRETFPPIMGLPWLGDL